MLKALTLSLTATLATTTSAETGWEVLEGVEIKEVISGDDWLAEKTFSDQLLDLAGPIEITGYYLPFAAQPFVQDFLLIQDPAGCPFCGSGEAGTLALEVSLKRPMSDIAEYSKIVVAGQLELIEDPLTFQAYRLIDARATPVN